MLGCALAPSSAFTTFLADGLTFKYCGSSKTAFTVGSLFCSRAAKSWTSGEAANFTKRVAASFDVDLELTAKPQPFVMDTPAPLPPFGRYGATAILPAIFDRAGLFSCDSQGE